jgi:CRP-like cAMP-binding protein
MSDAAVSLPAAGVFAECTDEELREIAGIGEPVTFEPDTAIVEEGDRGDAMYVIVEGEARVDVGGRFHVLKAGEMFGEMALIAPAKRLATVRAVTPVRALRVPAERFQSFVMDHPRVALAMMKTLVVRLREVEQRIDAWMA